MIRKISLARLKVDLDEILAEVQDGTWYIIDEKKQSVAALMSIDDYERVTDIFEESDSVYDDDQRSYRL